MLPGTEQSARYPADKGALSHDHRAAHSIYRWCERKLRSRSTPQRSVIHAGSTVPTTILDIRIPPCARGDQSPPTGQRDARWRPPRGASAKSPPDRCCWGAQQVADLAGPTAAILNSGLVLLHRDFALTLPGAGKPPPALHLSGRRFSRDGKPLGATSSG